MYVKFQSDNRNNGRGFSAFYLSSKSPDLRPKVRTYWLPLKRYLLSPLAHIVALNATLGFRESTGVDGNEWRQWHERFRPLIKQEEEQEKEEEIATHASVGSERARCVEGGENKLGQCAQTPLLVIALNCKIV